MTTTDAEEHPYATYQTPNFESGQLCWELDFDLDATVKKKRRLFKSEAEADAELERCKKQEKSYDKFWLLMTPLERQTTVAILQEKLVAIRVKITVASSIALR